MRRDAEFLKDLRIVIVLAEEGDAERGKLLFDATGASEPDLRSKPPTIERSSLDSARRHGAAENEDGASVFEWV